METPNHLIKPLTVDEIRAGNKVISNYYGFNPPALGRNGRTMIEQFRNETKSKRNESYWHYENMQFAHSLEWLWPVVEKIMETKYVMIHRNFCAINKTDHNEFNEWAAYVGVKVIDPQPDTKTAIFRAVVRFIEWHNSNNAEK